MSIRFNHATVFLFFIPALYTTKPMTHAKPLALVNLNGQSLETIDLNQIGAPGKTPAHAVSVFDRSFLFGDSLYEVIRTWNGNPFAIEEHFARLRQSARLCRLEIDPLLSELQNQTLRTIAAFQERVPESEVYCRLVLTRGSGTIGFDLKNIQTPPFYILIAQRLPEYPRDTWNKGLHLHLPSERIRNHRQALDPAMKSGNYLNNLLALLEAKDQGYDESILCNHEGFVTEGTVFNFFYVRRGVIATPPLDSGILSGVTRNLLVEAAQRAGIEVRQINFPPERVFEADEAFITGTTRDVFPVTQINGKSIGKGKPGPMTRKLQALYRECADQKVRKGNPNAIVS